MPNMWMVRAGKDSEHLESFRENKVVTMGWSATGDLSKLTKSDVIQQVFKAFPGYKKQKAIITASQLFRFSSEIALDDTVVTYDSSRRLYLVGRIAGPYRFVSNKELDCSHTRDVEWLREVERDQLSTPTKNTLGSISTLFMISDAPATEILACASGEKTAQQVFEDEDEEETEDQLLKDIQSRSREFIKDKLDKLDWDQMQEVVAGMLRAMGYKTKVSPPGADRGKDIVASPDGFGFQAPRIVVEVKHRNAAMGSDAIRSFLGGRHKDDKGLYVSTGGFTKEAHYEAERASIPVSLMDLDGLVDGILEHYEKIDADVRALIPLAKVYWPV